MRHAGTQEIETERLLLRKLLPQDAAMMYANWASDPEVTRYLRWEPHKNADETQELLAAWATLYPNRDYYQWAMAEKCSGQVIGSVSICNSLLGEPQQKTEWQGMELAEGIWEPGYCMGRRWWGQGLMTEALRAVTGFWFSCTDGQWLACCHAVDNPASGRVMEKAGFVYAHDAEYHKFDGTTVPCRAYCLTRERYLSLKQKGTHFERTV